MAPPAQGGGNFLTRKMGPLPTWAWAGLGVAGYLIYKQRKASAAAGASSTPTTTSTAASMPIAQAPSGYGYQGPGAGFGGSGPIPTGATAATSLGTSGVSGGGTGTFYPTTANYAQLNASGLANETYYDAGNGVYLPVTSTVASQGLATGKGLALGPTFTPS